MRFTILGPVELSAGGRSLPALAPRHRAVLAYLLLHARTVVGADRLIAAMWGPTPPDTARAQIHAAITAIRRALRAADAAHLLATRASGYVLLLEPGQLDLEEFSARLSAAERETEIRAALALWRDRPLADVDADYVPDARARLEDRRLTAVERLADLELSLGRHEELIDPLSAQLAAHPLRQRLCGQLMLALHRCGRQADGLAVAREFRARLVAEQGLDPGREFVALEQAILRDDPDVAAPLPAGFPAPRRVAFLPFDTPDFAGRTAELDRLAGSLAGGVVTISAIDGMAGIGKTALAIHAGHRLAGRFPDGQLFVDLQAHTAGQATVEPAAALEVLLRQLGVPAERIPAALPDRAALWRSELADRRVLAVLDNVADTDHVRPLLPGVSSSLILITSRRRLTDLDGAHALSLDLLPAKDAVELFTRIVGERAVAEPMAVLDVLQLCGFLPLAVRIAAARLNHRPQWTVEYLAGRLRDQRRRLTELSTSERGVAAAFSLSYQHLDPDQQRVFRLLGLHPGRDVDPHAAAALAGIPVERAERLLEDLLDAHVVLQHEPGRYTLHDLLREYARNTASTVEPAGHEALLRLLDFYLYTAATAVDLLYPYSTHLRPRIPAPSTASVPLDDPTLATAWLAAERANLIATADRDRPTHTCHLATILHRYLDDHALHDDALALHTQALHASRARGDRVAEVRALLDLAVTHWRQGRYEQSADHSRSALALSRELGDRLGEARAWYRLGLDAMRRRDFDQAHEHYRHSLEVNRQLGERLGEANVLGNLGVVYERQGDYERAHDHHHRALALYRELGTRGGEATTLGNLGLVYRRQGDHEQARTHHRRALELFRELGYRRDQAEALNGLGEAARAMGDPAQAVTEHGAALDLARELGNRPEQARAHAGLAHAHHDRGELARAREHATQAVELGVPEAAELRQFLDGLS